MKVIDFNGIPDKKRAAFVIFYCREAQPWRNYPADNSGRHDLKFPVCLMINRADGTVGFIGGNVEPDESLEEAAIREVVEEIGHTVSVQLEPLVAHDIGSITTHAFTAEVTYDELRTIQREAVNASHFGSEVTGVFLPHLIDYEAAIGKEGGLVPLLRTSMAPSVREELIHFLLKKELVDKEQLDDICERAGYDAVTLLK